MTDRFDSDKGRTHYVGDECSGGHRGDEAADLMCNILGKQTDPDWKPDPVTAGMVAAVLAAAEERGRRRGVIAQWGKIHELLALIDELADDLAPFTGDRVGAKWNRLRLGIEALAPRDSGPRKHKCMRCGGEFDCTAPGCVALYDVLPRMVRDGAVVEHECKPRDSGKGPSCLKCGGKHRTDDCGDRA